MRGRLRRNPHLVGVVGLWRKGEPAHEPGDRALLQQENSPLASAHARINGTTLTLDLSNSVPEIDRALTKENLGTLTIAAVDPQTQAATDLGSIDYSKYDRAAYEASAGIVSVPLARAPASNALLQLRDANGSALLAETALRAIPATPNLYLDENETASPNFQSYDRGAPAMGAFPVTIFTMSSNGGVINGQQTLTMDANGVLILPVSAT
jgi:hypothetical protein